MSTRKPPSPFIVAFLASCLSLAIGIGCSSDPTGPNTNEPNKLTFLVGCLGDGQNLAAGLYRLTNTSTGPTFEFITEYTPQYMSLKFASIKNGRIALRVEPRLVPQGKSGILYMDVADLKNLRWAPVPPAPENYWFQIANERPQVLSDGRIVYQVVLNTDNQFDDAHWGMLAVYNPSTDSIAVTGSTSDFVLNQPEKGPDTEGGSMRNTFVISPDEKYAYCHVYGYGTEGGMYHMDYNFVVRCDIGKPGVYTRVAQTDDRPTAVTHDGRYLILEGNGLRRIDLQSNQSEKIDEYAHYFNVNEVSRKGPRMLKSWRGSGVGLFDMSATPVWQYSILEGSSMTGSYRGLGLGVQFSSDESKVYVPASSDFYTNTPTDVRIFSSPVKALNTTPDSVTTIPRAYCTNFFMLLTD